MLRWICCHYRLTLAPCAAATFLMALFLSFRPLFTEARPAPLKGWLLAMVPVTLWCVLWCLSVHFTSARAIRSLNRDCDPEPLLDYADGILRQAGRKSWQGLAIQAQVNRGVALLSLGRFQEALEALDPALAEKGAVAAILWLDRASVFGSLGQAGEMVLCLDRVQALLDRDSSIKPNQMEALRSILEQDRLDHRLLVDGPSVELEAELEARLARVSLERPRVELHYTLARCALERRDREAARGHLEYVLSRGNKLYVRTQAQELLETLRGLGVAL